MARVLNIKYIDYNKESYSTVHDQYNQQPDNYRARIRDRESRIQLHFLSTDFEHLGGWIRRTAQATHEARERSIEHHINGAKGPWRTHDKFSTCWICDNDNFIAIQRTALQQLNDLLDLDQFQWRHKQTADNRIERHIEETTSNTPHPKVQYLLNKPD